MVRKLEPWVFLPLVAIAIALLTAPLIGQMPAGLIPDDGYFYAKIASNIALHGFSSFDGINPTDGYHQLWQYLLAGVAWIVTRFTLDRHVLLVSFLSLDFLFLLGASFVTGRDWVERAFVFAALACCEFLMEGHLLAMLIALGVYGLLRERRALAIICFALVPTARIDASLIPMAMAVGLFFFGQRRLSVQLFGAVLLGAGCHFGTMEVLHGHLWSVSSQLKTGNSGHHLLLLTNLGQRSPTLPIPFDPEGLVCLILGVLSLVAVLKSKEPSRPILGALWAGTAIFTFGHLCFSYVHPWYFAPAFLGFPLVLIWSYPTGKKRPLMISGAALSVLLLGAFCFKTVRNRKEAEPVNEFVTQMNQEVPSGDPIYMVDGSGYMGFYSNAPLINGDGLVNSHEYAKSLLAGRLGSYLADNRIQYFITNQTKVTGEPLIDIGGLKVMPGEAKPVVVKRLNGNYFFTNFVLWRLQSHS